MSECLLLRFPLPGTADAAEWLVLAGDGHRVGEPGRGTLADAAPLAPGRRLVVLVPGEDVVLAEAEIPGRGTARLARLAPFALEEQLAADIDTLHFAVGAAAAGRPVPVAAVDRGRLTGWLAALSAAGLAPAELYPDALALGVNPSRIIVLLDAGRILVRHPGGAPLVLDASPPATALALAGVGAGHDQVRGETHVVVYGREADLDTYRDALEVLRPRLDSLSIQLLAEGPLGLFSGTALSRASINLLQGEYATRQGFAGEWPRWRLTASLAGAFIALHLGSLGVDLWRLHRDEVQVDRQLHAAAAEALPAIHNLDRLPSLRAAVQSRLRATRAATSEGLVGALGALAAGTNTAPDTRIDTLNYRQGTTDVTVDAPDVAALDRLREAARGLGYSAELQGATQRENRFQGHMQLKGPG